MALTLTIKADKDQEGRVVIERLVAGNWRVETEVALEREGLKELPVADDQRVTVSPGAKPEYVAMPGQFTERLKTPEELRKEKEEKAKAEAEQKAKDAKAHEAGHEADVKHQPQPGHYDMPKHEEPKPHRK